MISCRRSWRRSVEFPALYRRYRGRDWNRVSIMIKRAPARRRPRKAKPGTKGLRPAECQIEELTGAAEEAAGAITKAGGCVLGSYKEPLGGHTVLFSILPIDAIEPTPF